MIPEIPDSGERPDEQAPSERRDGGARVPVIRTARLVMRGWTAQDRPPFAVMNADPRVMEHFPSTHTRAESDTFVDRIEQHWADRGYGLWALELRAGGRFIGYTGLWDARFEAPFTPAVEVGWRLSADAWGQGLATEAARAALRFGFTEAGLPEIVSFTSLPNVRSQRVMTRIGLRPGGEFDHPALPVGHRLRRHVLYRLDVATWRLDPDQGDAGQSSSASSSAVRAAPPGSTER